MKRVLSLHMLECLEEQLKRHEGDKWEIYICPAGHPTFGVGHKITAADPEFGNPVGSRVSRARVEEVLRKDISIAEDDFVSLCEAHDIKPRRMPSRVESAIINMAFNIGRSRLAGFKRMWAALAAEDYAMAAREMLDSRWAKQVGNRATELARQVEGNWDSP